MDELKSKDAPDPAAAPAPGPVMPAAWCGLALMGLLVGGGLVGVAAYDSESAGVTAMYVATFPLAFLVCGALGGVAIHLAGKTDPKVRIGGPLICGCLGGGAILVLVILFFVAIFPAL